MKRLTVILTISATLLLSSLTSLASRLTIEITQGAQGTTSVAVVPFGWQGTEQQPPQDIGLIIESNLERSGRFTALERQDMLTRPTSGIGINFRAWKLLNVDYLIVGNIHETAPGEYQVQVQLMNVASEKQLAGFRYPAGRSTFRRLANQISDVIYETLTGERGAFNTRIAYITSTGSQTLAYDLYIADADGHNAQSIVRSAQPLMSPAWSPDGQKLAYVSFEGQRAQIYIQNILTGQRERISAFAGINGAPAWSPDGRRLALTLSHKGNPDIYTFDIEARRFDRLTTSTAIDTEPEWSPDGSHILFTSDRGGKAQLYKIPAFGGRAERMTYEGDYNAGGVYSPDGKYIAIVHGRDQRYRIALLETDTGHLQILTDGSLDESPSFAPNGRILLYATTRAGIGVLSAVSVDGRYQQRLASQDGDVREPAWSPYNQ